MFCLILTKMGKNMKKFGIYLIVYGFTILLACSSEEPTQPVVRPLLSKMVAVGNSLTAGVQSAGLVEDFQLNSYPYLIAKQTGNAGDFQQPLISSPGVGEIYSISGAVYGPLKYENGQILRGDSIPGGVAGIPALLSNAYLARPYDNLGLPGADLDDILTATGGGVYDAILRNPYFGNTTVLEQVKLLDPTLILLWVGNNDVLAAALNGGDPAHITSIPDFQTRFTSIITDLSENVNATIIIANIPNVSDIPYINFLDGLVYKEFYLTGIGAILLPVVFDPDFQPVDFDTSAAELFLPLLTEESLSTSGSPVVHLLLTFLSEYFTNGLGVPDSAATVDLLVAQGVSLPEAALQAKLIQQILQSSGLIPSGISIPGTFTITAGEDNAIMAAVSGFNAAIDGIAASHTPPIPVVNANILLNQLNTAGIDGYTGEFVLSDPANTAFSLDGVHPNNGGYAIVANAFIDMINENLEVEIPRLNTADYKGQYSTLQPKIISRSAAEQVKSYFREY
jgi:lysophospholipase L1-like esterase